MLGRGVGGREDGQSSCLHCCGALKSRCREDSEFHEDNFARTEHPSSSSKDRGRQTEALIFGGCSIMY